MTNLKIRCIDFNATGESFVARAPEGFKMPMVIGSFVPPVDGADLAGMDVCLAIDAPDGWLAPEDVFLMLYLDSFNQERTLSEACFQIVFSKESQGDFLLQNPEKIAFYMLEALHDEGLFSVDFEDFLEVLRASHSRRLECVLISYPDPYKFPRDCLALFDFNTLYAYVFSDSGMTVGVFVELMEVLQALNPDARVLKGGCKVLPDNSPLLLLLGESGKDLVV